MTARAAVVIPTYNRAAFLASAVASALAQTLGEIEVIVVDDGSVDDTPAVIASLAARDPRVRPQRQPNRGLAAARNLGLTAVTAPLVAFLDDDDLWTDGALAELAAALPADAAGIACRAVAFVADAPAARAADVLAEPGRHAVRPWPPLPPPHVLRLEELLLRTQVPLNACLLRTERVRELGGFDEDLAAAEDYGLWLHLTERAPIPVLPRELALVRAHGGQMSRELARQAHETRRCLSRFLAGHPEARRLVPPWRLRRRLADLAREEAYARLLEGDRRGAARAAWAALRTRPADLKALAYLALSPAPGAYRALRRIAR